MLLYDIPPALRFAMDNGGAQLFGAIIKDTTTGQILGHVQQTAALPKLLETVAGTALNGFSPLSAISVVQNETLRRGVAALQEGMVLMQGLQFGTLALSGLGLGVSVAGFAVMAHKLNGIDKRLDQIAGAIGQITTERREDEVGTILSHLSSDLANVDSLTTRNDPSQAATSLQLSLDRHAQQLATYFRREADVTGRDSIQLDQIDRLWSLAAAIRLCQEASLQALFATNDLRTAEAHATRFLQDQMALAEAVSPDALSRLAVRGGAARDLSLAQTAQLAQGLRGGVMTLAGQGSIARVLQAQGVEGIGYLRELREEHSRPLAFLPA